MRSMAHNPVAARRIARVPAAAGADTPGACDGLFEGGPPRRLQTWLGLYPHIYRKAAVIAGIGAGISWLPLAVLSAAQSFFEQPDALESFGFDFAVHARCLVTVPLFIFAEVLIAPRLGWIARHFLDSGLVTSQDRPRFDAAVASTRRLHDSLLLEVGTIALTIFLVVVLGLSVPLAQFPHWYRAVGVLPHFSPAGWWHVLVSLPLLLVLFLGWMWRLFLWTRFLWLMSRLDLQLVPAHPDRVAGLRFVAHSLRAFSVLALALGALVAGAAANGIVHEGTPPLAYKHIFLGLVVLVVVLFNGPLLVFTGQLHRQWRRGVCEYGALASGIGQQLERKWFPRQGKIGGESLEAPDFSATTDLYSVVANVYEMRLIPIGLKSVLPLVVATLLPFVPLLLMAVPLGTLFEDLAKLLF
jgi:hypothetical protein